MDTDRYHCWFDLVIEPIGIPAARVMLDREVLFHGSLQQPKLIQCSHELALGPHIISVEHLDKDDLDPSTALRIDRVTINGITDPRFIWEATYQPCYPQLWFGQQTALGDQPKSQLKNTDYLGWNGIWRLEFTVPAFTWIHRIQNLGWIYD